MKNNMKRRFLVFSLIIVVVLTCAMILCSCNRSDGEGYTIESVYAEAQELGYTGTLEEFIELVSGKDGVDGVGLSNYQLWLQLNGKESTDEGYSLQDYFNYLKDSSATTTNNSSDDSSAVDYAIGSTLAVISEYIEDGETLSTGAGSGIIYKDTGSELYIVTNYHVIYFDKVTKTVEVGTFWGGTSQRTTTSYVSSIASKVRVYLYGMQYSTSSGYGIDATVVGGSYENDIAVLSLTGTSYTKYKDYVAKCGKMTDGTDLIRPVTESSDVANVGSKAIAIGNPAGEGISATSGIISVESETISIDIYWDKASNSYIASSLRVMRIDTAVNSGNSGGGLFNEKGEWVGIVNAKMSSSSVENISYAIPHEVASSIANNIIHYYEVQKTDEDTTNDTNFVNPKRLVLGVTVQATDSYAKAVSNGTTTIYELTINKIESDSVAGSLVGTDNEIKVGDTLVSATIGGKDVALDKLYKLKEEFTAIYEGTTFTLTINRDGVTKVLNVKVDADDFVTVK